MSTHSELRGQRVLVTGAAGFIGRHLVDRLDRDGAHVTALTRRSCDLTDREATMSAIAAARPDVVFHLAAARMGSGAGERHESTTVNALAGAWVAEGVPDSCHALIRLGSSTEYAESALPMDESTPLSPRGFFGSTKAAGSLLMAATAAERATRFCLLRAFQVYGPGDKPSRFVPTVMAAAVTGRPLLLTSPGMSRDWVWVGDVVEACVRAACDDALSPGSVFNIGTGTQTTNEELVDVASRVSGRRIDTRIGAHPGRGWDTSDWVADSAAARVELHWKPEVNLGEGLRRCWTRR